jgi:HEAT repeat protein
LTARALLAAGRDDDPRVRLNAGWIVTPAAGEAGRELLQDLLFDSDPMNRQSAVTFLRNQGNSRFLDTIESVRDSKWDESLSGTSPLSAKLVRNHSDETLRNLKEHGQAAVRADIAWALGGTKPAPATSAALLAALDDPDFEVRRGAARSLGRLGGDGVTDRLDGIPNTEDPRVRVMAAWSQVRLGDKRGYAHLSRLIAGEDARAATQACTALGRIAKRDAVALLLQASEDPRPVVRGAAVLALAERAKKGDAPHREAVDALVVRLAHDDDDYVRAAARAAQLRRVGRPVAATSPEDREGLERLGYVGYVDDADSGTDDSDDE